MLLWFSFLFEKGRIGLIKNNSRSQSPYWNSIRGPICFHVTWLGLHTFRSQLYVFPTRTLSQHCLRTVTTDIKPFVVMDSANVFRKWSRHVTESKDRTIQKMGLKTLNTTEIPKSIYCFLAFDQESTCPCPSCTLSPISQLKGSVCSHAGRQYLPIWPVNISFISH